MKKAPKRDRPSAASLKEMPEADFSKQKWERRPQIAARIAAEGMTLPGRGRPRKGQEVGPSVMKTVRFPKTFWDQLEKRARSRNLTVHAAIRLALAEWVGR
ncbi:MAG: hypothetical protein QM767_28425 [Anaeromyxobacter sp.]